MTKENIAEYVAEVKTRGIVRSLTYDLDTVGWFEFITDVIRINHCDKVYVMCNMETEFRLKRLMVADEWGVVRPKIEFGINNDFERTLSTIPSKEGICKLEALVFGDRYFSLPKGYIHEAQ